MTTPVDVGLIKTGHVLNSERETGVVWLAQDVIDQSRLSKVVHDPWGEITLEASDRWDIDLELGVSEGTSHDTAATGMTCDIERILVRGRFNIGSISSKSVRGIKDGRLKDGSAVVVGDRCVERPIPVSAKSDQFVITE